MGRVQLFDGLPDVAQTSKQVRLDVDSTQRVLLELEFICKTITRLGRGYALGSAAFSRPDTDAARAMDRAKSDPDELERQWVFSDELAETLADRAGLSLDLADAFIAEVTEQVTEHGGGLTVATRDVELEAAVERQLLADPEVLAIWGWPLAEIRSQVALGPGNRADIIGRDENGNWVVVELKRYAALEETGEQICRYLEAADVLLATGSETVRGLVIADGDDREFHETVDGLPVSYLPLRRLGLPACRPQQHLFDNGERAVWVAADGRTVVRADPNLEAFTTAGADSLLDLAPKLLAQQHQPVPVIRAVRIVD